METHRKIYSQRPSLSFQPAGAKIMISTFRFSWLATVWLSRCENDAAENNDAAGGWALFCDLCDPLSPPSLSSAQRTRRYRFCAFLCVRENVCVRHSLTHRQSQALLVKGRRRVDGRILRRRRKQSRLFSRCYLLQICAHIVYPGVVRSPEFFTTLLWGVNLGHALISSHPASCFNFPHRPWGIKTIFSLTKIFTIYFKKSLIWRVNSSGETHV